MSIHVVPGRFGSTRTRGMLLRTSVIARIIVTINNHISVSVIINVRVHPLWLFWLSCTTRLGQLLHTTFHRWIKEYKRAPLLGLSHYPVFQPNIYPLLSHPGWLPQNMIALRV